VKPDNPEVLAARAKWLPVVRRAEMLGELMRLKWSVAIGGTHGKTTTTSLVAALLEAGGFDPTVINGGIINNYGTNARLGAGDWMVVEADESDGTFVKLPATIAIVTNMDPEHLDHYGSVDAMNRAYEEFVKNIPFYGFAALCIDHPVVQAMIRASPIGASSPTVSRRRPIFAPSTSKWRRRARPSPSSSATASARRSGKSRT
jgi:UDP-N-acetylmuramate--alanine ligase